MSGRCSGDDAGHRYVVPLEPVASDGSLAGQYWAEARATVARLDRAGAPGYTRPRAMAVFDELMAGSGRVEELEADPRKVVGVLCNFVPEELVLAAGALPVRLDLGHGASSRAGGRALSGDVCATVRSLVGARLGALPLHRRVDLLVVPTACEAKKKLCGVLGGPLWVMELPQRKQGAAARERWRDEVRALAARLERLTGQRIRRRGLRAAIELLNRRTATSRRLDRLRQQRPGCLGAGDAFLVAQASFISDAAWWIQRVEELLEELESPVADDGASPHRPVPPAASGSLQAARPRAASCDESLGVPLLLTGSPVLFPDFRLLHLLDEAGARVVADEMCSGSQRLYNPVVLDEGSLGSMMRAVADRALLPCTCPCFISGDDRVDRVLELLRLSGAAGVVHHTLRLCLPYGMELPRLAAELGRRGIPLLELAADPGDEDGGSGPLQNRVAAFLEMLCSRFRAAGHWQWRPGTRRDPRP